MVSMELGVRSNVPVRTGQIVTTYKAPAHVLQAGQ